MKRHRLACAPRKAPKRPRMTCFKTLRVCCRCFRTHSFEELECYTTQRFRDEAARPYKTREQSCRGRPLYCTNMQPQPCIHVLQVHVRIVLFAPIVGVPLLGRLSNLRKTATRKRHWTAKDDSAKPAPDAEAAKDVDPNQD